MGLALVAAQKGYRLILVIPDKMSREKISNLKAMGAKVVLTRSDVAKGHPEYYQDMAKRLASEIEGAFFINQFGNPSNPRAHEEVTGPEIWRQMDGQTGRDRIGVGSSGTVTGLSRYFARKARRNWNWLWRTRLVRSSPDTSMKVCCQPREQLAVEGIGEDFLPTISDFTRVNSAYSIPDEGELPGGPGTAAKRRDTRRFVHGHTGCGRTALLP